MGLLVLAAWLMQAAGGSEQYAAFVSLMGSPLGLIVLVGFTYSFFYHLCNGIRHLVWDAGRGFEKHQANASAWAVLVVSVLLTAAFWGVVL